MASVHDDAFLDALLGLFASENEIGEQQKLAGQIQSWAPAEIPALQVPKGGKFDDEQTRRQIVQLCLESLVDDLKAKIPQGKQLNSSVLISLPFFSSVHHYRFSIHQAWPRTANQFPD